MNFYIDFDHTLYNTNELILDLINACANYILENGDFELFPVNFKKYYPTLEPIKINKNFDTITQVLKDNFKRPEETYLKIDYNIFSLASTFCNLFNCNYNEMKSIINNLINNGEKYLYSDSMPFLEYLKKHGHMIYILSHERYDLQFQNQKIQGSKIFFPKFIDAMILCKISKSILNDTALKDTENVYFSTTSKTKSVPCHVDYKNGIFIDDRPKDLEGIFNTCLNENSHLNAKVYRIKRSNGTYSDVSFSPNFKFGSNIEIINSFGELYKVFD